jgi:hypothetical protein
VLAFAGGAAADPPTALLACREISDPTARLACFDRESAGLASAEAARAQELPPEQKFGLTPAEVAKREPASARSAEVEALTARIVGLRAGGDGRLVFALDNGQEWRQLVPGDDLLVRAGDTVRVDHGALGSFWLHAPSGRACKVTRDR